MSDLLERLQAATMPRTATRIATLFLVGFLIGACEIGSGPTSRAAQSQVFLVGPQPLDGRTPNRRFLIEVPSDYVPREQVSEETSPLEVGRLTFFVNSRTFRPASGLPRTDPSTLMLSVFWAPENFVSSRVDGTWLNAMSAYSVRLANEHGLEVRRPDYNGGQHKRLYLSLSASKDVVIECAYLPDVRPSFCRMWSIADGPALEIWFDRALLPSWSEMESRARELIEPWIKSQ